MCDGDEGVLRMGMQVQGGASEDAAGLSTKTRDVRVDRGVTIKMSRHWMRLLNTRIYALTISHLSCTHCALSHTIFTLSHLARCLYAHLTLICQFITATHLNLFFTFWYGVGCFFGLQIYIWSTYALNIFSENIFSSNFQVEYQPLSGLIWFQKYF